MKMLDDAMIGMETLSIALAGNPNAGKTSLFNALTGAHQKVGNYPGVTVEKLEGMRRRAGRTYRFTDLPGVYSLTAYSVDEIVTRDFLLNEKPDLIVDVLDSTNLERNLYLCLQFQELGIPVVAALNMSDEAAEKGIRIDTALLSKILGIPMVRTVGSKAEGIEELFETIDAVGRGLEPAALDRTSEPKLVRYGTELESKIDALEATIGTDPAFAARYPARWLAVKLLEKDSHAFELLAAHGDCSAVSVLARDATRWIEKHYGKDSEVVISEQRYGYIRGAVKESVRIVKKPNFSVTEAVDNVIMHPFLALPIFVGVLWGVFQITFTLGAYPQGWLESLFAWFGTAAGSAVPDGLLRSLIVDGIIGGVGSVFSFVPLIVILFFLLSVLEDIGYMARAAFATDKILHSFGLHGQSVFPMMLGFGCSVPAIMAARTLKNRRDRIVTILVIPFMSCGAKLPVYVLLAGAFFPGREASMVMLVYAAGVVLSLLSSAVLKRTLLKGDPTPFVMELPPYRIPTLRGVVWHVWEKTIMYVKKMGTVIMAAAVLVWAVTTFPVYSLPEPELTALESAYNAAHPAADRAAVDAYLESAEAEAALAHSAAGRIGRFIAPVFEPIGFDWKLSVATLTGFAAKEVTVSTLGILYSVGTDVTEENAALRESLKSDPVWNPVLAFALMLFTLVIPPCLASLATIKNELGWRWLAFEFFFMFAFGWLLAFAVVQIGGSAGLLAAVPAAAVKAVAG